LLRISPHKCGGSEWARTVAAITLLVSLLSTASCTAIVVGDGDRAGVYTWVKGEMIRSCAKDVAHTENATIQSLDYLKVTIDEKPRRAAKPPPRQARATVPR